MVEARHAHYERALGAETCAAVAGARVLVVGAGGIGCELLKNLVLAGFRDVEVVDLDTIDVSNLNRQFLFRARHVGSSKAEVARAAAGAFDGSARLRAHHANVKEARFGVAFVASFALVFMALDNVAARRHVNRLCLAASVPLLESGTAGYLGQVQVIRRGHTECYDCREKPRPKAFPYCTIHNTPSRPEHCVIWAKAKFSDAFSAAGATAEEAAQAEAAQAAEASDAAADAAMAAEDAAVEALLGRDWPRGLFRRLFHRDLLKRRLLAALRPPPAGPGLAPRPPPAPRLPPAPEALAEAEREERQAREERHASGQAQAPALAEQRVWGPAESTRVFLEASARLRARAGPTAWDKDDDDALDWVAAASNLRADLFGIAPQSRFDCKAMAGNIIPAIATTNAVIAGLLVLEALRLLAGRPEACRYTYLLQRPSGKKVLLDLPLPRPSAACFVCQASVLQVRVDTRATPLAAFVADVLQARLGLVQPSLYVGASGIYECGDDLDDEERRDQEALAARPMCDVQLVDGAILRVEDDGQELSFDILITHAEGERKEGGTWFELVGKDAEKDESAAQQQEKDQSAAQQQEEVEEADADAEMAEAPARGTKRKAGASDEEPSSKRKR